VNSTSLNRQSRRGYICTRVAVSRDSDTIGMKWIRLKGWRGDVNANPVSVQSYCIIIYLQYLNIITLLQSADTITLLHQYHSLYSYIIY